MAESSRARLIIDVIGLTTIVASLAFLAVEVRQNTAATQAMTQQAILEAGNELSINLMTNERLREVLVAAEQEPQLLGNSETADYLLLRAFFTARFNYMENAYFHHSEGTLAPGLWLGVDKWIKSVLSPTHQHFWTELQAGYLPEFRQYMDSVGFSGTNQ